MTNRIIIASFDDQTAAFEAAQEIENLDRNGTIKMKRGGIITKDANGNVSIPDVKYADKSWGPLGGGAIGAPIDLLLGPAGAAGTLGAAGITVGAAGDTLFNAAGLDETDQWIHRITADIEPGQTVLVAELDEESTELVDAAVTRRGGRVFRTKREVGKVEQAEQQVGHKLAALSAKTESEIEAEEARRDWEHDTLKENDTKVVELITIDQQSKYDVYANSQGPASTRPLEELK